MNLSEIKLNEKNLKHFENRQYKPTWENDCEKYMSRNEFDNFFASWQAAEDDVFFEGIRIVYDSGDLEYQHNPEFPVGIEINGYEIESEIEDDGLYIYHNGFLFRLVFEKSTLQDFVDACRICGIEIRLKNNDYKSANQPQGATTEK